MDQPSVHPSSATRPGPDGQTGGWITRLRQVIRHGDGNRLNRSQPVHTNPPMTDQPTVHPSSAARLGPDGQTGGWITRLRRVIRHGDGNRLNRSQPFHAAPPMTDQPTVHPSSDTRFGFDVQTGGWITRLRRVIRHGDDNRPMRAQPLHADPPMMDQPAVHPSSATRLGLDG
ncbi:hypothetical protein SAMN05216264_104110 [Pseudomonas marincola]|nr:hypothetical protein SAMN05216264_104110 [Pseudomonas marincola]